MSIFSRFTDIINSNINSMLDNAEDPQKMIRLIIQEMEETLIEVRSSCARIIADKKQIQRKAARLQQEATEWENKAKLAISKGRDDLARAAIAEKSSCEVAAAEVEAELVALDDNLAVLSDEISQLQTKLDDAKAQQKALLIRAQTAQNRHKIKSQLHKQSGPNAFDKFETFQRKLDDIEGQVEAFDVGRKDLADEIDQLAKNDKIDEELERLKQQLGK